jgi:flagellar protein FliO/FliZ
MKFSPLRFVLLVPVALAHADIGRVFAAPATPMKGAPSVVGSLGEVTFALALVLAAVFVAAWLLRRVRGIGSAARGTLDVIADLPLGPKERAVLVRVGKTQLLIGVAPGRVTTLHVLAEPVDAAMPLATQGRPTFHALLMKSLGKS